MFSRTVTASVAIVSALLIFTACGKPSERLLSDRLRENNDQILGEMCDALVQTARFDTAARRGVMKDYDLPLSVMPEIEKQISDPSSFAPLCGTYVLSAVLSYERSKASADTEATDDGAAPTPATEADGGEKAAMVKACTDSGEAEKNCTCIVNNLETSLDADTFKVVATAMAADDAAGDKMMDELSAEKQDALMAALTSAGMTCLM
jgi:hypothetical protein